MRTKVTLVLLLLNVALFFFIFGFEREWRIEEQAKQARRRVLGPEAANIQFIEITGQSLAAPLRLRRSPDAWMLTSPVEWPANPHAVDRIVNELQFLEHQTSFSVEDLTSEGQTLADYGLAEPALTVAFATTAPELGATAPEGEMITLAIGAETSIGNRLYILSPDRDRVHVVPRSLADSLRVTLEQLRARTCFTIPVFEVRSLNLETSGPANARVRLRRQGNRWEFEAPFVARASKTATELAIIDLNELETHTFLGSARTQPELPVRTGTSQPGLRITLEGNNRRETLLLGRPVDESTTSPAAPARPAQPAAGAAATPDATETTPTTLYHAQIEDRDAVFTVAIPVDLLQKLRDAQEELRDPRVLPLEGRDVTAITLKAQNYPELNLQRLEPGTGATDSPANWQIVRTGSTAGPQTRPADREIVERLLQHLAVLSVVEDGGFLRDVPSEAELENWGLTRPEREITLTLAPDPTNPAAPTQLRLRLGVATEHQDRVYAKLDNQSFVYLVSPEILRVTPVVPRLYRDRLIYELPAGGRLAGLSLTDLETGQTLYQRALGEGETWDAVFAAEPSERAAALQVLRGQVRTLRAQRFVADTFTSTVPVQGEARPWALRLDATLALSGRSAEEQEIIRLFFGPRVGGSTQLVGSPQFDVTFEADQALLDAIWALTYGPRDPGPPETVTPPAPAPVEPQP